MLNTKKKFLTIWTLFAFFLIVQQRFVFMHFDDWGYASLSYGYTGNLNGMSWNVSDLIGFLKWHYLNWGGRVLWYGILISAFRCGEGFTQFLQAIFIFFVFYSSYLLIKREKEDCIASYLIILTYGFIGLPAISNGVFWFAASAGYVWPFACLFSAIYILEYKDTTTVKDKILATILFFFAGFSQEQVAVLTIVYVCVSFALKGREKQRQDLIPSGVAIVAGAIEILAPGNFVRSEVSSEQDLGLINKIINHLSGILSANVGDGFTVILLFVAVAFLFLFFKKQILCKKGCFILLITLDSFVGAGVLYTFVCSNNNFTGLLIIRLFFCLVIFAQILTYLIVSRLFTLLALFIGAICSQGMMLASPYMVERCALPFKFVMSLIVIHIVINEAKEYKYLFMSIVLFMTTVAFINLTWITYGYASNCCVNLINRYKMQEKAAQYHAGAPVKDIILYRLTDDRFVSQMPYQQDFIEVYVKNYYGIPQETNIIWQQLGEYEYEYERVEEDCPKISAVWPDVIDASFERSEDGGVSVAVTPSRMDSNLSIIVNDAEMETVKDLHAFTTHVNKELLTDDLRIRLFDKETEKYSDVVVLRVEQ